MSFLKDFGEDVSKLLGDKNEVVQSTGEALEERITSPFYGYFLLSWVLYNWYFLYVALFVDQELIFQQTSLLRNEYLLSFFANFSLFKILIQFFFAPLLLTILFFWFFPFVTRPFFRKNLRNKKVLKLIELEENQEEVKKEIELVQSQTELLKEEAEKAKEVKKASKEDPTIVWEIEFEEFKKNKYLYEKFSQIVEAVYIHNGETTVPHQYFPEQNSFQVEKDILAFVDSNELVKLIKGNISLTNKGKYFVKKYSELQTEK